MPTRRFYFPCARRADAQSAIVMVAHASPACPHRKGARSPFREAHEEVGKIVLECERKGWNLVLLNLQQLQELIEHASEELLGRLSIEGDIASKVSMGGPSLSAMAKQIAAVKQALRQT